MLVVVFIMAFEINTSAVKDKPYKCPCECIGLVEDAVNDVLTSSSCDFYSFWEVPKNLEDQLDDLKKACQKSNKRDKEKTSEIVEEMLETINISIVGESQILNGKTTVVNEPAPDCAIKALLNLQSVLLYGCSVQLFE